MKILKLFYDTTLGKVSLRMSDKIIALTPKNKKEIIACGGKSSQIVIIPNGIKFAIFQDLPNDEKFRKKYLLKDKYILFVGRLAWHKGLDYLITTMKEVRKLNLKLVLIGEDGGVRAKLERLVMDKELEKDVIFTGKTDFETLLSAYSGCELFVLPSFHEGLPTVLLEAMACGKIVVSTYSVAGDLIKNRVNGYLVHYGNVVELQNVLQHIISNDVNSDKVRKNAINTAKKFDWSILIGKIVELYYDKEL